MAEVLKVKKVPWIPLIILIIFFCFFAPSFSRMVPFTIGRYFSFGALGCGLHLPIAAFIMVILAKPVAKLFGKDINDATMCYVYTVGVIVASMGEYARWPDGSEGVAIWNDRYIHPVESTIFYPWFWAPATQIAQQIKSGGVPIPWIDWLPTILWWSAVYIFTQLVVTSLIAIFRRSWIEIERLPFPQTLLMYETFKRVYSSEKKPLLKSFGRPFLIGMCVGIITHSLLLGTYLFPWFPDVYGWRVQTCGTGTYRIAPDSPLAGVVGFAMFSKNPIYFPIFFLAPLSITFSIWFWYLITTILMQAAYTMGYYTGLVDLSGCGRWWCGANSIGNGDPFKWRVLSDSGMTLGVVLFYLILSRRYIVETLRAALGNLGKERTAEVEKNEPMTYRTAYTMLLVTSFLWMGLWIVSGIGWSVIVMYLGFFIWTFCKTLVISRLGIQGGGYEHGTLMRTLVWQTPPTPITSEYVISSTVPCYWTYGSSINSMALESSGSIKMADITGAINRNVFKVIIVTLVLTPFFAIPGLIWGYYTFGQSKLPSTATWSYIDGWGDPASFLSNPAAGPVVSWVPHVIAGVALAGVLMFLHAKFIWFPLDPFGFLIAMGDFYVYGLWTVAFVAWLLKTILIRLGGSKAFENYGVPFAGGFFAGYALIAFIGMLAFVSKFFMPW